MKTLYLDCGMGAAGDMLTAALLELLPDPAGFVAELNALGLPGVTFSREKAVKCGITGTQMRVSVHGEEEGEHEHTHAHAHDHDHEHHHEHEHDHVHEHEHHDHHDHAHAHHHHSSMAEISAMIAGLSLPETVKDDVRAVYDLLASAESQAHGVPVSEIHFHEVGTLDAIADIAAVCLLMARLAPEKVVASPVHVGSGQVQCAHGIMPVPAPATAWLLREVPIYGGEVRGELCTPTGAALLRHFVTEFGDMPLMQVSAIGYGMGKKNFAAANCVRAMLGETAAAAQEVCELSCNLDDMTAEAVGFAMERLFEAGALEVYTVPVGMKKSRPGLLLQVLCRPAEREAVVRTIFRHTTTIGIRESRCSRYVLDRSEETLETALGSVRRKISSGYGVSRAKYEYEDLARIARARGLSLEEVKKQL